MCCIAASSASLCCAELRKFIGFIVRLGCDWRSTPLKLYLSSCSLFFANPVLVHGWCVVALLLVEFVIMAEVTTNFFLSAGAFLSDLALRGLNTLVFLLMCLIDFGGFKLLQNTHKI